MAIALTSLSKPYSIGDRFRTLTSVALDNSYVTGGYPLTRAQLGFSATADPEFHAEIDNANGWSLTYDYVNQKLMAWASANVQVANAADLSSVTAVRILCSGRFKA